MRSSDSANHPHIATARAFLLGACAGQILLTICLLENLSNLGYAVLDGGLWSLLGLAGAFGLALGGLAASIMLASLMLGSTAADAGPERMQPRKSGPPLPRL